jgi:hypothetical protein
VLSSDNPLVVLAMMAGIGVAGFTLTALVVWLRGMF